MDGDPAVHGGRGGCPNVPDRFHKVGIQICYIYFNVIYRSLNIVFFPENFVIFSELPVLLQLWCSTCLVCVHTLTPRENRVRNIFKNSEKNTIFNEHPVHSLQSILISKYLQIPVCSFYRTTTHQNVLYPRPLHYTKKNSQKSNESHHTVFCHIAVLFPNFVPLFHLTPYHVTPPPCTISHRQCNVFLALLRTIIN